MAPKEAFPADVQARLDRIGPHVVLREEGAVEVEWAAPPALANDLAPADLRFECLSESGRLTPDDRMFELWEAFAAHKAERMAALRSHLVDLFRGVTWDDDRSGPEWTDDRISGLTQRLSFRVSREDFGDEEEEPEYTVSVNCRVEWDDEHGYQSDLDADTGEWGAWY